MSTYLRNKEDIRKELFALAKIGKSKELIEGIKANSIDIKTLTEPDEFDQFDEKITENGVEEYDWDVDTTDIDSENNNRDIFEPFQIITYSIDKKQKSTAEELISFCIKERKYERVEDKYILLKIACMYRLRGAVEDIIESENQAREKKAGGAKPPSKLLDPKTYPNTNVSPLFHACIGEDKKIINSIIKAGFNPAGKEHQYVIACASLNHTDAMETLLENYPSKEIESLKDYLNKEAKTKGMTLTEEKERTRTLETIVESINEEEKRRKAVLKEKISKKMIASDNIEI
jgi:hypothetical protein